MSHSRSTQLSIGPAPLVQDPYESCTVEVNTVIWNRDATWVDMTVLIAQVRFSQVEGGGEGLYARRNIAKGEIVAFYNGVSASLSSSLN